MSLIKKRGMALVVLVALVASMLVVSGCGSKPATVAEVNGKKITKADLDSYVNVNHLFDPQLEKMLASKEGRAAIEQYYLDEMIQMVLLIQLAEELKVEVKQEDVDNLYKHIKMQLASMTGSEEKLAEQMKKLKIKEQDLSEPIKSLVYQDGILAHFSAQVTSEEVTAHLTDYLDISHILVKTEEEALAARERLLAGETFAGLAKELSTCPSSAEGGKLGLIEAETQQYDKDFMAAAKTLTPDEVSMPVKTQFGWHLILVSSHTEASIEKGKSLVAQKKMDERLAQFKESADIQKKL